MALGGDFFVRPFQEKKSRVEVAAEAACFVALPRDSAAITRHRALPGTPSASLFGVIFSLERP